MASKIEGLWSKGRKFLIGKDLPDKVEIIIYDLAIEDFSLASRLAKLQDESIDPVEKTSIMVDFISKVLRLPKEDVGLINIDYLEEIMDAATSVLNTDERSRKVRARLNNTQRVVETVEKIQDG